MQMKKTPTTPPPGSKPDGLTARQEKLLSFLAGNPNIQAAANAAGIGRTTVHRWLKDPAFREELTRRRNRALTEAMNSVQAYTAQAVEELIKLMGSP
jgi:transposase